MIGKCHCGGEIHQFKRDSFPVPLSACKRCGQEYGPITGAALPKADCDKCYHFVEQTEGQHCYMFADKPGERCGQFKARAVHRKHPTQCETLMDEVRDLTAARDRLQQEKDKALHMMKGIIKWAMSTYCWEGFWEDQGWNPESQHDQNGKKLIEWVKSCEDTFPEIKEWRENS